MCRPVFSSPDMASQISLLVVVVTHSVARPVITTMEGGPSSPPLPSLHGGAEEGFGRILCHHHSFIRKLHICTAVVRRGVVAVVRDALDVWQKKIPVPVLHVLLRRMCKGSPIKTLAIFILFRSSACVFGPLLHVMSSRQVVFCPLFSKEVLCRDSPNIRTVASPIAPLLGESW